MLLGAISATTAVEAAAVEAASVETAAASVKAAAPMAAATAYVHTGCCRRLNRAHQGQSCQARYGRSGYGVSHHGELQCFWIQRRRAERVPFLAVRAAPGIRDQKEGSLSTQSLSPVVTSQARCPGDGEIARYVVWGCERDHRLAPRCACLSSPRCMASQSKIGSHLQLVRDPHRSFFRPNARFAPMVGAAQMQRRAVYPLA
jgi:hypothetical protein